MKAQSLPDPSAPAAANLLPVSLTCQPRPPPRGPGMGPGRLRGAREQRHDYSSTDCLKCHYVTASSRQVRGKFARNFMHVSRSA
eukprot:scaffold12911_cov67-Phaeocystis_antarctica.AAC.6